MAGLVLSVRDRELLDALTRRVRVLTLAQIARTWWGHTSEPTRAARQRLSDLEAIGLLEPVSVLAHPELALSCPVVTWRPGAPPPLLATTSNRLRARWTASPTVHPSVIATAAAGRHFGGSAGRRPRLTEQTHDVHLSAVYLLTRAAAPARAASWQSEATIRASRPQRRGEKVPDAIVTDDRGPLVIEFGGAYARPKLEAFHAFCAARELPYEVW